MAPLSKSNYQAEARGTDLGGIKARVRALRETMMAARLDYLRARLELALATGHSADADRLTRQVRNLLNEQRPRRLKTTPKTVTFKQATPEKRGHSTGLPVPSHCDRTATASQDNTAAGAAKE